jgi:dTDP-glucose pyrophosphorylase
MDAVIPAAGQGTRLRPLTADRPKALVTVAGRPIIAHVFEALGAADVAQYVVVVGYRGEQIVEYFGDSYGGTPIEYVWQDQQRGLADAVLQAAPVVTDDLLVCNGDNVFSTGLDRLRDAHTGAGTLLVETVSRAEARTTGVVVTDEHGDVRQFVEKPDDPPGTLVGSGAYAFSPAIFDACRAIEPSDRGEYELPDAVTWLVDRGETVGTLAYQGQRVNVNTPEDVDAAESMLAERS